MKKVLFLLSLLVSVQSTLAMEMTSSEEQELEVMEEIDLNQQLLEKIKPGASVKEIRGLIEEGADINAKNKCGDTALTLGARGGHTEICLALIEEGADIEVQGGYGYTALIWAAGGGDTKIAKALIDKGANIEVQSENGCTALMTAARNGHTEMVNILIDKGANIEAKNNNSQTVLMSATYGHADICLALIGKGADTSARDKFGRTALMYAAIMWNAEVCRTIVSHSIILPKSSKQHFITV